jgi:hypothetical protein
MQGYLSLVLHAHLPFVRHPEHEKFLEESWLFEAVTETYIPLIQILENWQRDGIDAKLTLSLSPTLCTMLGDSLLRARYEKHLNSLIELAEKEIHRTHWDRAFRELAWMYHHKFSLARETWRYYEGNLVSASKNSRTKAASKSSRPARRTDFCRCSPIIRRPSARRFSRRAIIIANVSGATRAESGCRNAPTFPASRNFCRRQTSAGSSSTRTASCTPSRVRVTARSRRFSRPTASPRSGAISIPRARSGASTKAIPATRVTAIFTATSASTSISIT